MPNTENPKGAYAHGSLPGMKELFAQQSLPNMDEVARQSPIDKAKLLEWLVSEYSDTNNNIKTRYGIRKVLNEIQSGRFDSESHRLLIEERESHGPEGRNYTNAQYVELRLKVAEQDKEIRKLEDLLHETNIKSSQFATQKIEESTEQLRFFREAIENLKDK